MTVNQHCCFVLWGEQCDEVAAVLFIAQLRALGIRVWVVGIGGRRCGGIHGLALVPDLAIDQALPLAAQSMAVIIPCRADQWLHFLNDPRLATFLLECRRHEAFLLMAEGKYAAVIAAEYLAIGLPIESLLMYPTDETLPTFVQTFAERLRRRPN